MTAAMRVAWLVASSLSCAATAHAQSPGVSHQGTEFGPRITFHAGRPAPGESLDRSLEDPAVLGTGELAEAVIVLGRDPSLENLEVAGHADPQECSGVQCEALALRRATLERDWLVANGVRPDRLGVAGYGASRPLGDPSTGRNRRVELDVGKSASRGRRPASPDGAVVGPSR